MKVKFIEATRYRDDGRLLKARTLFYPALTFPLLAALTPRDVEIVMSHELLEDIDFAEPVDLVALTSITNNVLRAYEIADEFRRRGVPVVMGGFHASVEPEEALAHVDAVFIGEAEETWPEFLGDFRRGAMRRVYKSERRSRLDALPLPRFDILDSGHYFGYGRRGLRRRLLPPVIPVQTARGCPQACDFCDITRFEAGAYRPRPVPDVVAEIRARAARVVCFVDDNIFAKHARAKDLFRALLPLRLRWYGQGTLAAAEDADLLELARRSGCRGILAGIETISEASLASVGKHGLNRVEAYGRWLRAFRDAGIDINASMTFGFDGDGPDVFDATYDFLVKNRVPFAGLQPIRPSPGTPLYDRLKEAGRLKAARWWLDRGLTARVFELKFTGGAIPDAEFGPGLFRLYRRFYSWPSLVRRFLLPPGRGFAVRILATLALRRRISPHAFISEC